MNSIHTHHADSKAERELLSNDDDRLASNIPSTPSSCADGVPKQPRALAFDLDPDSLTSLRNALPGWTIAVVSGATESSLAHQWHPEEMDLLVVQSQGEANKTVGLCRFLARCSGTSQDSQKAAADILGPRGSLKTGAQRAHAPLLLLVPAGQADLVKSALEAGAHSCLVMPIDAKDVVRMLVHAREGNHPGRHTRDLEGA